MTDLCFTPARQLARLLKTRKVSTAEVMRAFIAPIERVNPKINAIVTFLPEAALESAKALDRSKSKPPLAGLPHTVEDCVFLLSAMAGPAPRAPTSIPEPGARLLFVYLHGGA